MRHNIPNSRFDRDEKRGDEKTVKQLKKDEGYQQN